MKHHKDNGTLKRYKPADMPVPTKKPAESAVKINKFICQNPSPCDEGKNYEWEVPESCVSQANSCPNCGSPAVSAIKITTGRIY